MTTVINYIKNAATFLLMCGLTLWAFLSRQEEKKKRKRLEMIIEAKNAQTQKQMEVIKRQQVRREQIEKEIEEGKRDFFE